MTLPRGKLLRINITQDDVDAGVRCNHRLDPVGIAIRRKHPDVDQVSVAPGYTHIDGIRFRNPPELSQWIIEFDCGRKVKPQTFFIEQQTPGHIGGMI